MLAPSNTSACGVVLYFIEASVCASNFNVFALLVNAIYPLPAPNFVFMFELVLPVNVVILPVTL